MDAAIANLLRLADRAQDSKDHVGALRYGGEVLRLYPENDSARLHVALNVAMLAREEAGTRFGHKRKASALQALRGVIEVMRHRGKTLSAIAAASTGLAIEANDPDIHRLLDDLHRDITGRGLRATTAPQKIPKRRPLIPRSETMAEHSVLQDDDEALIEHAVELATSGADEIAQEEFEDVPLFPRLSQPLFMTMVRALRTRRYPPNTVLIEQGGRDTSVFLIVEGRVRVTRETDEGTETLALLGEGAMVGEMAWVNQSERSATVMTAGPALTLEITADHLHAAASQMPDIWRELLAFATDRLIANLLSRSPLFEKFSPSERTEIIRAFRRVQVANGERFITEGTPSQGLYIIAQGRVRISKRLGSRQEMVMATMAQGDVLGAVSVAQGGPAPSSATATEESMLLLLERERFDEEARRRPEIYEYVRALSDERIADQERRLTVDPHEMATEQIVIF